MFINESVAWLRSLNFPIALLSGAKLLPFCLVFSLLFSAQLPSVIVASCLSLHNIALLAASCNLNHV